MEAKREKQYNKYVAALCNSGKDYATIGRYVKYTLDFMENTASVDRRGYLRYRRDNVDIIGRIPQASDAICDLLSFLKVGYNRQRKEEIKPLEQTEQISDKNSKLIDDFIVWLAGSNDYSSHTIDIYRTSLKSFFSYAAEINMDSCKRYLKTLEQKGFAPQTIRLRITAIERFSKWIKKPIELKRPKMRRTLCVENVPTEKEYNKLLDYLLTKDNKDYYYLVKVLATTGVRVSEFLQFTWEDIASGEVTLKGKGGKYRRILFKKDLQKEIREYMETKGRTGLFVTNKQGDLLSKRGLTERLQRWGRHCGIAKEKMHPHAFRHFFAKMFLKKCKDVVQLADLLGHGSVDTTRIYLQRSNDEQKRDFNRNVTW
mgnify:FL=1